MSEFDKKKTLLYSQSSELAPPILAPGGVAGPGREPGCPPATPPVFLLSSELKKFARTPSLVVAAPGFTAVGSICNSKLCYTFVKQPGRGRHKAQH